VVRGAFPLQDRQESRSKTVHLVELDDAPRPLERLLEAVVVERFHQIIHGRDLERLERVTVVGRHEDGERHLVHTDLAHHFAAGPARNLNVQEHQGGARRANRCDGSAAVADLPGDLQVGLAPHHVGDALPGQRLVVHDEHAQGFLAHVRSPAAAGASAM
jgi:hypothetical protein